MRITEEDEKKISNRDNRRLSKMKWFILFCACIASFSNFYCLDNPGALHNALAKFFELELGDDFEYYFNLLYSLVILPNIFLPFVGGILIMKVGLRPMYIIFMFFIVIGQLVFSIGCSRKEIITMLIGRLIYGLGTDTVATAKHIMLFKWFDKKEITFPFGIALSISRFGSIINDICSPLISNYLGNVETALWVGFFITIVGMTCLLILIIIDCKYDESRNGVMESEEAQLNLTFKESLNNLNTMYWFLLLAAIFFYGAVISFNYISTSFFIEVFFSNLSKEEAETKAGIYMSIPFFIGATGIPILGIVVNSIGKRSYILISGTICGIVSFVILYGAQPLFALILLGIAYTLFATVIWPSVTLVVNKLMLAFAFGIFSSIMNACLFLFQFIVILIFHKTKSYYMTITFFIALQILSLLATINLHLEDKRLDNIINNPNKHDEVKLIYSESHIILSGDKQLDLLEKTEAAIRASAYKNISGHNKMIEEEKEMAGLEH